MTMQIHRHRAGLVPGPGIYLMPASVYHADPVPEPSLSNSIACELVHNTPRHAWLKHPRLNPNYDWESGSTSAEFGSVVHKLATGRGRGIVVLDVPDFRSKAAQEARAAAQATGKLVLKRADRERADAILHSVRLRLRSIDECKGAFRKGLGEPVLIWKDEAGIWGRCQIDWWGPAETDLWDLKTTTGGLSTEQVSRRIVDAGYDMQAAWYERAVCHLRPELAGRLRFRFVFVEANEPHECRPFELDGEALAVARRKVAYAVELWKRCLRSGNWPGYPAEITRVTTPVYAEKAWLEREMADSVMRDAGLDPFLHRAAWRPRQQVRPRTQLMEIVP